MTTTTEKIAELKRLMAEATPRPWYRTGPLDEEETGVLGGVDMGLLSAPDGDDANQTNLIDDPKEADYDLIAAAVNALPDLLADIEMLREALKAVSQKHPGYGGTGDIARKALAATEVQP
jgi:hypothetical protein